MNEESVRREPRIMSETSSGEGDAREATEKEKRRDDRVREKRENGRVKNTRERDIDREQWRGRLRVNAYAGGAGRNEKNTRD